MSAINRNSVSILISAFNEEQNIQNAVDSVKRALKNTVLDWEIIIVNDGSTDNTGEICQKLSSKDKRIVLINHSVNRGLGVVFRAAVAKSSKKYFTLFPGDNEMDWRSLRDLLRNKNNVDIVFSYTTGPVKRPLYRRLCSTAFTIVTNVLFGLQVKYYNGPFILKTGLLKKLQLKANDYLIFAEIKIRLLKSGASFKETPFKNLGRKHGKSKAFSLGNIISTLETLAMLKRTIP